MILSCRRLIRCCNHAVITQPGLAHVLLTSWALDFESRDYRFLAHKSGILPTLQSVVTLTNTASLASSGFDSLDGVSDTSPGLKEVAASNDASPTALEGWTPWSLENIREGFLQVIIRKREIQWHKAVASVMALALAVSCGFCETFSRYMPWRADGVWYLTVTCVELT